MTQDHDPHRRPAGPARDGAPLSRERLLPGYQQREKDRVIDRAQFGSFELRRGMHPADGGIVRLVNTCGVGIALEMELTGEPISAQRALAANMVSKVVPHDDLMAAAEDMVARILRNDRRAVESAKETIFEVVGRTLDEQLKVECLLGYALCGGNPDLVKRSQEFVEKKGKGRVGVNATSQ